MSKVLTLASLAIGLLISAAPASAQDWVSSILTEQRRESGNSEARPARANAERATRTNRFANADDSDDGSRPQRRSASKRQPAESLSGGGETGVASYYWEPQALASGGRFNPNAMTAAHKTLPFGTRVRVTHLGNGNSVEVVINDRGPYVAGRIIDLSKRAAQNIGMTGSGVARVRVAVLGR